MPGTSYSTYSDESPDASIGEKVSNSVRKIVADVGQLAAPRSVAAAKQRESDNEDAALGRMRQAQSTDRDNSYSYAWIAALPLIGLLLASNAARLAG